MPRGWCWWLLLTQGKWPVIQIGNQKIPWVPGMGMGWLIWYSLLTGQQPQIQFTETSPIKTTSREEEIEYLKRMKEELEKQLEEIKRKLEELEKGRKYQQ